jgi:hypothetical protein
MTESLMTEAATTTEGNASQDVGSAQPTGGEQSTMQQQAEGTQNQQQGQQSADAGNDDANNEAPKGAPEKYEFTAPEGREYDPGVLTAYSEVAKELNLPQEAAQKMIDKIAPLIEARQVEQVETIRTEWAEAAKADQEFGGDKLNENLAVAKKALDKFGSPELRTLLNDSGLGNNPEVIRFMYRAGKAISEDTFVGGSKGNQKSGPKNFNDLASALYSNQ